MVRRLKSDLRYFGAKFPKREIEAFEIKDLPRDASELLLSRMLLRYGEALRAKSANMGAREAGFLRLSFVGLQQRLLSSIAAFAKTLAVHRKGLAKSDEAASPAAAEAFVQGGPEPEDESDDPAAGQSFIDAEESEAAEAAGALAATAANLALIDEMLALARKHAHQPDARVRQLTSWIRRHMASEGRWNERRLVLFTEYEDTRRWLEIQLAEALDDLAPDDRIASFTSATSTERREDLKRRFNSDPAVEPLRILICTDAAREGINLQMRCHDLIHVDLPWNPARLEQRNGRIDRKLQPSPQVWCRYFVYEQRPEDVVLQALVRKTERIREQLGSAGQVIGQRLSEKLEREGIWRAQAQAREIDEASDERLERTAVEEMDDETAARRARQAKELDELRSLREESRERVGVEPEMLERVVAEAMSRAGASLDAARAGEINGVQLFRLDPNDPAFVGGGWAEALDDLRIRRRKRSESLKDWRANAPLSAVSFRPALTDDSVDVEGVLQLHLEHRLVRRLLSRFLSQGFASGLSRASVVIGPGAQPRVVLLGRLALYGPGAARLHEEFLLVTAAWMSRDTGRRLSSPSEWFVRRRRWSNSTTRSAIRARPRNKSSSAFGPGRRTTPKTLSRSCCAAPKRERPRRSETSPRSATPRPGRSAASSKTNGHASPRPTPSPRTYSSPCSTRPRRSNGGATDAAGRRSSKNWPVGDDIVGRPYALRLLGDVLRGAFPHHQTRPYVSVRPPRTRGHCRWIRLLPRATFAADDGSGNSLRGRRARALRSREAVRRGPPQEGNNDQRHSDR